MRSLKRWVTRLLNSLTGRIDNQRLKEEIEEHLALETTENLRAGLRPHEARRQTILKFGGVEGIKEDYQAERAMQWIFLQDLRFSIRVLRKSPAFTIVAVVTLALGIAANAIVFSVMNALIPHPLNVPQAESLYQQQSCRGMISDSRLVFKLPRSFTVLFQIGQGVVQMDSVFF